MPNSQKGAPWFKVLKTPVIYRRLDAGSEWKLHRTWFDRSDMVDLLGCECRSRSRKQLPFQRALVNGPQNIVWVDVGCSRQIRQSPDDLENPVMRTGGEIRFLHRVLQIAVALGAELAVLPDLPRAYGRVRRVGELLEALQLGAPRSENVADVFSETFYGKISCKIKRWHVS